MYWLLNAIEIIYLMEKFFYAYTVYKNYDTERN